MKKIKKILIAPNSFKHSLSSLAVAKAIQKGINNSSLRNYQTHLIPIADGGTDTLSCLSNIFQTEYKKSIVKNPLGKTVQANWLLDKNMTAYLQMAQASGIHLLSNQQLNPYRTNTYGTGQLIIDAINHGAKQIILGIGGTATVDVGVGMLSALGARFYDKNKQLISQGNMLMDLEQIQLESIDKRIFQIPITILSDVKNKLLGSKGAARVFGPQKGATPQMVDVLQGKIKRFTQKLQQKQFKICTQMEGGGAAGGFAFTLKSLLDCKVVSGAQFIIQKAISHIQQYDLVITGEGKLDSQSLQGKGPQILGSICKQKKIAIICICGIFQFDNNLQQYFQCIFSISNGIISKRQSIQNGGFYIERVSREIGNLLSIQFQ